MAILPTVLLACLLGSDWLVDPAGGGDFTSIQAAIASSAVQPGDRLWIAPGEYGQISLAKSLDLLALPGQRFHADQVLVQGIAGLTIQGLTARYLLIEDVQGRVELLDVEVGRDAVIAGDPTVAMVYGQTQIYRCPEVLMAGCLLRGTRQCYPDYSTSPKTALVLEDSRVSIAATTILGPEDLGVTAGVYFCTPHYPSPPALSAHNTQLSLSGVTILGGASNMPGGWALRMDGGGLDARGSGVELWSAGQAQTDPIAGTGATGVLSGIQLSPPTLPAWLSSPTELLPLLSAPALADAGGSYTIELWAPPGEPAAVLLSAFPALDLQVLAPLGALWFDPLAPFASYLELGAGFVQPAARTFTLPSAPALLGSVITLQAFLPPCGTPACSWGGQGSLTPPIAALVH
jgi:hypothetical protein